MTKSYIRELGPKTVANGYKVVAIRPNSKAPIGKAWQENPLTEKECAEYPEKSAGVGILCGVGDMPICCLDIDCSDRDIVDEILNEIEAVAKFPLPKRDFHSPSSIDKKYSI